MKTFFVFLIISMAVIAGIYYYYDGFEELNITHGSKGPYRLIFQDIDAEDARLEKLLDNLTAYLEREKNISPDKSFEYYGFFPGKSGKVKLTGYLLNNEHIKGKLRRDIKLRTIIRTKCISGTFNYKNNISELIFEHIKLPEFKAYLDTNNFSDRQFLKIKDKKSGIIEVVIPEFEWKIK